MWTLGVFVHGGVELALYLQPPWRRLSWGQLALRASFTVYAN